MIKAFNLPVYGDEVVRVVYQKPNTTEIAALPAAPPKRRARVRTHDWGLEPDDDVSRKPYQKPAIVMMHDFPGGHKDGTDGLFSELERRCAFMGFPTIRFDFRGCGESDGLEEDFTLDSALEDLNAVLQWAQHDAGQRSVVLLGEGLGATIAVMGFRPQVVGGLILLWPALKPRETFFKDLFTRENLLAADAEDKPYVTFRGHRLGSPLIHEIYQCELTDLLHDADAPTLIQHGTADADVPVEQAVFARDTMPDVVDFALFEGGEHGLRQAPMREAALTNIQHYLTRVFKKLDRNA